MNVLKFGGTSVANAENIIKVINILKSEAKDTQLLAVISALGGITDVLLEAGELANAKDEAYLTTFDAIKARHLETVEALFPEHIKEDIISEVSAILERLKDILQGIYLINEFSFKTRDKVLSFGELLSSYIISEALKLHVKDAQLKDSRELIATDSYFTKANIKEELTNQNITSYFKSSKASVTVLPGFISRNEIGETTTLGRGGSDYTAAILASALNASQLEIWTDVSGMYTAHPKLVKQAFPIAQISYQEAMELSHFGAKVLYPPTIQPVLDKNIPILIKNTFFPEDKGTRIVPTVSEDNPIKGISHLEQIALLTLEGNGMVGVPGYSRRLFEALSLNGINVALITQASSEHSICVGILDSDVTKAVEALHLEFEYDIDKHKINPVQVEENLAIVALIGDQMKSHQGISGRMFSALGENNVNIRAIAQGASERNISAVIAKKDVSKALNILHNRFFEEQVKTLNLFIMGVGNVGHRLIEQIAKQQQHLMDTLLIDIKVIGLANSKQMYFNELGVDLSHWKKALKSGRPQTLQTWIENIDALNLRNSIFLDITANQSVAESYAEYLKRSIAVVACNKIACSSNYSNYKELKRLSKKYNAPFLFETNVGAGLPVINTLNNLVNSGDKVTSIKAVLSGSLNFIFNNFNDAISFHDVVKQAQAEGYTEPDPRIDLSGVDVARKILILLRESGLQMDIEDIENNMFLPQASMDAESVDAFYETLKTHNNHFNHLLAEATAKDCKLKYVAEFNNGSAKVGLQHIPKGHPLYNLEGKDNIVIFNSERYIDQPLLIKGAGAGAEVTASGLFGDIISLARS